MGRHSGSPSGPRFELEDMQPLPVSTKDDGPEAAGLLGNSSISGAGGPSSSSKHAAAAFDVEFVDEDDDDLIDWQQHGGSSSRRCCSCGWLEQHMPEWWWHLPRTRRRMLLAAGWVAVAALAGALIAGVVAGVRSSGGSSSSNSSTVRYTPLPMRPEDSPLCSWSSLYLPKQLAPSSYALQLTADMAAPQYAVSGSLEIGLVVASPSEPTPCVVLSSLGINIQHVSLRVHDDDASDAAPAEVPGSVAQVNEELQQVTLQFPSALPLPPLRGVLVLRFTYQLQEALDGFYRSSFVDAANETKVMASTQFESIAARKAFPCFDEPGFKAPFEVKITAPGPPYVVLSNMPLSHTHGGHGSDGSSSGSAGTGISASAGGLVTYHFERSPPMSSYLVAWVIGELAHIETSCMLQLPAPQLPGDDGAGAGTHQQPHGDADGHSEEPYDVDDGERGRSVAVRVWGTSDRAAQFGHAQAVACHALQTFEQLLQVAYPLPKLDLVAIPNFAAGAMENWGLLMYRETALLVDDAADDMRQRYDIATTVSHETAHQWFGDLVTLDDWTELWLNEGFASYFEVVSADAYRPAWRYFDDFYAATTSTGLEADGSSTSHPLTISRPTKQLEEIDNWFDSVSYSKGAAVIRMLRAWLNRGNAPLLGFSSSSSSGGVGDEGGNATSAAPQHARRRLQLQGAAADASSGSSGGSRRLLQGGGWAGAKAQLRRGSGAGSSGDSSGGAWRLEQQGELEASSEDAPQEQQAAPHAAAAAADLGADSTASSEDSGSSGSGSNSSWWTARSHIGSSATAGLQQQEPQRQVAAGGGAVVAAAPPVVTAAAADTPAGLGAAGSAEQLLAGLGMRVDDDVFLLGLRRYLRQLSYGNANYTQLWQALAQESGEPVQEMMETWTLRRGFPIVTVSLDGSTSGDSGSSSGSSNQLLLLEQVAYHAPRSYMVGLPFEPDMYCNDWTDNVQDSSWWIPVALRIAGSNDVEWHSFSNCSNNLTLSLPHNGWVLANAGRFGFYRVNYSEPLWAALARAAVDRSQISSVDFAGLLDDAYSLSLVRQLNISVFLSLTRALGDRFLAERPPWSIGLGWLQRMSDVLASAAMLGDGSGGGRWRDCLGHLTRYVTSQLTEPFIDHVQVPGQARPGLGFQVNPGEPPELRLLRPQVLTAAGFLGHTRVMEQAAALLKQVAAGQAVLSPDVSKAVYSLAAGSGDEAVYDTLQRMYEQALDAADKDRALRSLARVTTRPLISRTLAYALSPSVRSQDVSTLLVHLAKQGGLGFNMTWEFVIDRVDDIMAKYGGGDVTYSLGRPLNSLATLFVDEDLLARLRQLAARQPKLLSPTFLDEANEAVIRNTEWLRFQGADACAWLEAAAAGGGRAG